jgi:hypothetical protein
VFRVRNDSHFLILKTEQIAPYRQPQSSLSRSSKVRTFWLCSVQCAVCVLVPRALAHVTSDDHGLVPATIHQHYRLVYWSSDQIDILPNVRHDDPLTRRYYAITPLAGDRPSDICPRVDLLPACRYLLQYFTVVLSPPTICQLVY